MEADVDDIGHLILEVFRLNGRLLAVGDGIVGRLGLTSARWQVLGAIIRAEQLLTVSQLARDAGVSRQAVQRIVNALTAESLVEMVESQQDKRAPLVQVTKTGRRVYGDADHARREWLSGISEALTKEGVGQAASTLRALRQGLANSE